MIHRHSGEPGRPDDFFFASPPPEIGPILTADTDVKKGQLAGPGCTAFLAAPLVGLIGEIIAFFITDGNGPMMFVGSAVAMVLTAASFFLIWSLHPNGECSFVGQAGLAWFERRLRSVKTKAVARFADVADVRVKRTQMDRWGRHFVVEWLFVDARGQVIARVVGTHIMDDPIKTARFGYWFGHRAYDAWATFKQAQYPGNA